MICPNCGRESREGAEFCGKCGQPLLLERICSQCGHKNSLENSYCEKCGKTLVEKVPVSTTQPPPPSPIPTSFANGRYQVKKFLGEGGKKKVYLVHDTVLDRDVAFALIKTEKLDETNRTRIIREAQAMGRLGDHPNIVGIYEMGDEKGQPYIVSPLMPGGDIESIIEKAPERRLPIEQALSITRAICKGLEYAHGKGIIHRDIKPGNVWISADGTARVGDFGLALAVDLSRLTHEGIMVGTYYYMPPEQAMSGEITPRADLYSLGAMLYEMVTGRPPFTGDDTVSIIGQHINTPPISPSWHRPEISPALAALIMRLLEKDPQKRPASATEVLKVIEAIEAGKAEQLSSQQTEVLAENPLYRRVFVGREAELRQLQSAFDAAASGKGSLIMVVGEPGIGKTALTEQLATYVSLHNGRTLLGYCYEEGSLSLPYLAFVEALRIYAQSRDVSELKKELGAGAADVARIVSEVRERLKIQPRPRGDSEEERYRLMQAVTNFLGNAAAAQPLLIVLEDLHSADRGTLEMLEHIARNVADKRLLLVGTYRDVEVDRTHPLSAALAELRRLPSFGRVLLRGLNADEVRRMLSSITGQEVPWGLAEAVHRQTEGNPLFVQEVVRYLVEEGVITREKGLWQAKGDTPVEMRIPDGLRDVIGKRLSSLSESCNKVLSVAAVIGRDFRLEVLQKVAGVSDEELFKALEEARKAAVVEERTGAGATVNYRFAHAFFRQTLYEEIIAPRRIRLHQQVARALEEVYKTRLEEHAAELAEHFSYSAVEDDLKKAVSYGEMAAQRALSVYAYGENVRLLERVVKIQEVLDPENKAKLCDLLRALSNALTMAGEPRRALDIYLPTALSLAEALNDHSRGSRVCLMAMMALANYGTTLIAHTSEFVKWVELADRCAEPGTVNRVLADAFLGTMHCVSGNYKEGVSLLRRALDLARQLDNPNTFWLAAFLYSMYAAAPRRADERLRIAEELATTPHIGINMTTLGTALFHMGSTFLESGHRQRAEDFFSEMRNLTERSAQPILVLLAMRGDLFRATLDGHMDEALDISRRMRDRGVELGLPESASAAAAYFSLTPHIHTGRYEEALQLVRPLPLSQVAVASAICLAYLQRNNEVVKILDEFVMARSGVGSIEDETPAYVDTMLLKAAVIIKYRQAAELLLHRLAGTGVRATSYFFMTCIPRHLGAAATLLGRPEEAITHYHESIEIATKMRFRPELALTRLQLAQLLLEYYPEKKSEALDHLNYAITEFRDMKMQPCLESALRHKQILKA